MIKGFKKTLVVTVLTAAMALATTGCAKVATIEEKAQGVVDAYQNDTEEFMSHLDGEGKMLHMMEALDDEAAEGMIEVYQKVYELTKDAEITVVEKKENSSETVVVNIKTVDFTDAINDAMADAIAESGEAFENLPEWLMSALNTGGEPVEMEVELRIKSNSDLYENANEDFFNALTGGFYDYIMYTMTTCYANNEYDDTTYMLANYDVVKISVDEFFLSTEDYGYSETEIQTMIKQFAAGYNKYDGIYAGGNIVEGGVRFYLVTNYDVASSYTLQLLGLASSGYSDYISLDASIDGLSSEGFTCESFDFGSGALD